MARFERLWLLGNAVFALAATGYLYARFWAQGNHAGILIGGAIIVGGALIGSLIVGMVVLAILEWWDEVRPAIVRHTLPTITMIVLIAAGIMGLGLVLALVESAAHFWRSLL